MIKCQNCGNTNNPESHFCRFCGTKFRVQQTHVPVVNNPYDFAAPRPYSWKTDEFQTQNEARKTLNASATAPIASQFQDARTRNVDQQIGFRAHQEMSQPYRCPHCMSQFLPRIERRISTAGWITFAVLLVFSMGLFCWIGLLIKEDTRVCPSCNGRVG